MSDENGSEPNGRPPLLTVADGGDETGESGLELPGSKAYLQGRVRRGEVVKFITTAAMAMGEKIYNQIASEHTRVFAEMEKRLSDRIMVLESKLGITPETTDGEG